MRPPIPLHRPRRVRGFTLIELIIVILVMSVLVLIALPAYTDSVRKARRAQAKADLLETAQVFERCFTVNNSYDPPAGTPCAGIANGCVLSAPLDRSPRSGGTVYYNITVPTCTATTFTLAATAAGDQANDLCLNLGLNHTGVKTTTSTRTDCW